MAEKLPTRTRNEFISLFDELDRDIERAVANQKWIKNYERMVKRRKIAS